jgi:hypothetical protein
MPVGKRIKKQPNLIKGAHDDVEETNTVGRCLEAMRNGT